jgi:hypothetical protein
MTNETKVGEFFLNNDCTIIHNFKARYKALCYDEVVVINDHFIVDFNSNKTYKYRAIKEVVKENNAIILHNNKNTESLYFKTNKERDAFYEALKQKQ